MGTGAFPSAETPTDNESVQLEEPYDTLNLLFQYLYMVDHPTLEDATFDQVLQVAEAAEKYVVVSTIPVCHLRLRFNLSIPTFDV